MTQYYITSHNKAYDSGDGVIGTSCPYWRVNKQIDAVVSARIVDCCTREDAEFIVSLCYQRDAQVDALCTLASDAEMALSGEWDRSDAGFSAQLDVINEVMTEKERSIHVERDGR